MGEFLETVPGINGNRALYSSHKKVFSHPPP